MDGILVADLPVTVAAKHGGSATTIAFGDLSLVQRQKLLPRGKGCAQCDYFTTSCGSAMVLPFPWQPFGEFFTSLMWGDERTELAQLTVCCATLYITRSDPELLKRLMTRLVTEFNKRRGELRSDLITNATLRRKSRAQRELNSARSHNITDGCDVVSGQLQLQQQLLRGDTDVFKSSDEGRMHHAGGSTSSRQDSQWTADDVLMEQHRTQSSGGTSRGAGGASPPLAARTSSFVPTSTPSGARSSERGDVIGSSESDGGDDDVEDQDDGDADADIIANAPHEMLSRERSRRSIRRADRKYMLDHLFSMLHAAVTHYFRYNWNHVDDLIAVNRRYRKVVEDSLIPAALQRRVSPEFSCGGVATHSTALTPAEQPSEQRERSVPPTPTKSTIDHLGLSVEPERMTSSTAAPLPLPHRDAESCGFLTVTEETVDDVCRVCDADNALLVLFFHVFFSEPSCAMWSVLAALMSSWNRSGSSDDVTSTERRPKVVVGVVHGVTELNLVRDFNVTWYPTLIVVRRGWASRLGIHLLHRHNTVPSPQSLTAMQVQATAAFPSSESASVGSSLPDMPPTTCDIILAGNRRDGCVDPSCTCPKDEVEQPVYYRFPETGLVYENVVGEWILSEGAAAPPQRKFKKFCTPIVTLLRAQRFKGMRDLHTACVMLSRLQRRPDDAPPEVTELYTPEDPPVFVFLGGGMAAGKTTAATALTHSDWWKRSGDKAVVVDADAFKVSDPIYGTRADGDTHRKSTRSAELLLLHALNHGRSVVFDGTMMWAPFVEQTIAMVREAHTHTFSMGDGFVPSKGIEEYWVRNKEPRAKPLGAPYVVKMLAITVEPAEAVPRGIIRAITTGRRVPVVGQLRSFRLFATNFERYVSWCDEATLYNNNVRVDLDKGELPPEIFTSVLAADGDDDDIGAGSVGAATLLSNLKRHPLYRNHRIHIENQFDYEQFLRHQTINDDAPDCRTLFHPPAAAMSPVMSSVFLSLSPISEPR